MRLGLAMKFDRGGQFARLLLSTGEAELIEGNSWGDDIWGMVWETTARYGGSGGFWRGQNLLGSLLMERRDALRSGDD